MMDPMDHMLKVSLQHLYTSVVLLYRKGLKNSEISCLSLNLKINSVQ